MPYVFIYYCPRQNLPKLVPCWTVEEALAQSVKSDQLFELVSFQTDFELRTKELGGWHISR